MQILSVSPLPGQSEVMAKNVLVSLGDNTRVVAFQSGGDGADDLSSLSDAIKGIFKDVLLPGQTFFLQVSSSEWGGMFIDLGSGVSVKEKSVIKAVLQQVCVNDENCSSTNTCFMYSSKCI